MEGIHEHEGIHPLAFLASQLAEAVKARQEEARSLGEAALALKELAGSLREAQKPERRPVTVPAEPEISVTKSILPGIRANWDTMRGMSGAIRTTVRLSERPVPLLDAVKATWTLTGASGLANLIPPEIRPVLPRPYTGGLVPYLLASGAYYASTTGQINVVTIGQGGTEGFGDFQLIATEGGAKPEQPAPTIATASLSPYPVAGYFAISRLAMISDENTVATMVERFWQRALFRQMETHILGVVPGDPVNGYLDVLTGSLVVDQPDDGSGNATELDYDTLIRARAAIETDGFVPNVIICRPTVQARILHQHATTREYIEMPERLRDLTWILSPVVPPNVVIIGELSQDTTLLWEHRGVEVVLSTEHADFFARNLVAVRVEWIGNFAVLQAPAYRRVNLAPNPMPIS